MKVKVAIILSILLVAIYLTSSMETFVGLEPRHATCKVGKGVEYTLTIQTQQPKCFFIEISGINSSWVRNLPSRICLSDEKTIKFSVIPEKEGYYSFAIRVSSQHSENIVRAYLNVVKSNNPPTSLAVTPDKFAPQPPGSIINWTASAYDPDGDTLYYRFWLLKPGESQESIVRDWSTNNVWTWNTAGLQEGTYTIFVDVKDGKHGEIDKFVKFKYVLLSS